MLLNLKKCNKYKKMSRNFINKIKIWKTRFFLFFLWIIRDQLVWGFAQQYQLIHSDSWECVMSSAPSSSSSGRWSSAGRARSSHTDWAPFFSVLDPEGHQGSVPGPHPKLDCTKEHRRTGCMCVAGEGRPSPKLWTFERKDAKLQASSWNVYLQSAGPVSTSRWGKFLNARKI